MKKLTHKDQQFLKHIQKAIFTNPFSTDWLSATSAICPKAHGVKNNGKRLKLLEDTVADYLGNLAHQGINNCQSLTGNHRKLFKYGVQFLLFHRFSHILDNQIQQQLEAGITNIPFTDQSILASLHEYGFSEEESCHTLALFFQMRRAFHFIGQIIGTSPSISQLRRNLWRLIFTDDISLYEKHLWNRMEDFSTLILGETGTGKGIAAKAIGSSGFIPYDHNTRKFAISFNEGFLPFNLSQISPHLLESELFGHKKGSFTGAVSDHLGIFSRCSSHGAIFLDEIGEITPQMQVKLLQILQERIFTPVGSQSPLRFSGRIIAATHQNIDKMRQEKLFRDDFYYRLCTETIYIPTLAKRFEETPQELDLLVQVVLRKILGMHETSLTKQITTTLHHLVPDQYSWPGNVRELEQCVRRILLKGSCEFEQLPAMEIQFPQKITAKRLLQQYCTSLYDEYNTFEAVARITHLDRRTVKRYITERQN
jgi:transcriptional regulator with PAS, ATPase and Fis domain